jgi:hypothetical protein
MSREPQETVLDNISFADQLPIEWVRVPELPSAGEMQRVYCANEEILQNLLLRDDAVSLDTDEGEEESAHEHFKRLETRLDLLLSLMTEMMSRNGSLPPQRTVTISGRGLCVHFQDDVSVDVSKGALLKIDLYLDPQFPRPVTLYAQVVDVQARAFTVGYCPFEARMQDLLDKYVFRQHRRAIALARRSEKS